jgi:hypothetical protein
MEITWLFLEFIIQMLYLQSIPSRSHKGAQTHAVGPNNNYLPIYELSPPSNVPIPAQRQNYRGIPRMLLCLAIVYISRPLTRFPLSPALSPGCLGI